MTFCEFLRLLDLALFPRLNSNWMDFGGKWALGWTDGIAQLKNEVYAGYELSTCNYVRIGGYGDRHEAVLEVNGLKNFFVWFRGFLLCYEAEDYWWFELTSCCVCFHKTFIPTVKIKHFLKVWHLNHGFESCYDKWYTGYRMRQVFVGNVLWQCQLMGHQFCCSLPSQLILPCCQIIKIKSKQIWLITRKIGLYCARLSNFWVSQSDRPYKVQFIEIRANRLVWKMFFAQFIVHF